LCLSFRWIEPILKDIDAGHKYNDIAGQEANTQRHTSFLHQPRIKLFQSVKLLINPRVTDRALEKFKRNLAQVFPQTFIYFLFSDLILLSAGQLVPAMMD